MVVSSFTFVQVQLEKTGELSFSVRCTANAPNKELFTITKNNLIGFHKMISPQQHKMNNNKTSVSNQKNQVVFKTLDRGVSGIIENLPNVAVGAGFPSRGFCFEEQQKVVRHNEQQTFQKKIKNFKAVVQFSVAILIKQTSTKSNKIQPDSPEQAFHCNVC